MKRLLLVIAIILLFIGCSDFSYAYWVWTPETGKWVNPKYAVRDTPEEQMEWATSFYKERKYDRAVREFNQLIKTYPNSSLAPDAQYYIGKCREEQKSYYDAFLAYQVVIDRYPYTNKIDEIIEAQYNIGNLFYSGQKAKFLGVSILPAYDKAVEIFKKVVDNAPFGKFADLAQFKLGLSYKKQMLYQDAKDAFKKLTEQYPESKLIDDAKYEMAVCAAAISLRPSYNQDQTAAALEEFQKLQKDSKIGQIKDITKEVEELKNKLAQYNWNIAEYYRKIGNYISAKIYYNDIVANCSSTKWASLAAKRLQHLEGKLEKELYKIAKENERFEKEQMLKNKKAEKELKVKDEKLAREIAKQNAIEEKKIAQQKKNEEARVARDRLLEEKRLARQKINEEKISLQDKKVQLKELTKEEKIKEKQKRIEEKRLERQKKIEEAQEAKRKKIEARQKKIGEAKEAGQEKIDAQERKIEEAKVQKEIIEKKKLEEEKSSEEKVPKESEQLEAKEIQQESIERQKRLETMKLAKEKDEQQRLLEEAIQRQKEPENLLPQEVKKEKEPAQKDVREKFATLDDIRCEISQDYTKLVLFITTDKPITIYASQTDNPLELLIDIDASLFSKIDKDKSFQEGIISSVKVVDKDIPLPEGLEKDYYAIDFLAVYLKKTASYEVLREGNEAIIKLTAKETLEEKNEPR